MEPGCVCFGACDSMESRHMPLWTVSWVCVKRLQRRGHQLAHLAKMIYACPNPNPSPMLVFWLMANGPHLYLAGERVSKVE